MTSAFRNFDRGVGHQSGQVEEWPAGRCFADRDSGGGSVRFHLDVDPCDAGRAERYLERKKMWPLSPQDGRGVVKLTGGGSDGVVELGADRGPCVVDATDPSGADDPLGVGVGIVEYVWRTPALLRCR